MVSGKGTPPRMADDDDDDDYVIDEDDVDEVIELDEGHDAEEDDDDDIGEGTVGGMRGSLVGGSGVVRMLVSFYYKTEN